MSTTGRELDSRIRSLLAGLRWRIRAYVWLEGICLGLVWVGLTFWAGLAVDYLPVLVGASEMPRAARAVLLAIIATVLAWILYRWILRRTWVRLADHSMAILLERRHGGFEDSLVTAVELAERPDHAQGFRPDMLDQTTEQALAGTAHVRPGDVFNYRPLVRNVLAAVAVLATIAIFYAVDNEKLAIWAQRLYLLRDRPWPRSARIEVVGIELMGSAGTLERAAEMPFIPFEGRRVKVARGANVRLRVRADLGAEVVPKVCTFYYRTEDAQRGRVPMSRSKTRGHYQDYSFAGKPLRGILSTIHFDVVGYDFRARDYTIQVVDSPAVTGVDLDCRFPDYLVDEALSLWLPRSEPLTPATQLPRGTDVTIRCHVNKRLRRVDLYDPERKEAARLSIEGSDRARRQFEYRVASLDDNLTLDLTLYDVDNVVTERPYRIFIAAKPDEAPTVDVTFQGIGTAVTPDVVVPIEGAISDDYAVDKAWFDFQTVRGGTDGRQQTREFSIKQGGQVEASLDFRYLRAQDDALQLRAGDKLMLAIKAADKYDLGDGPNIGSSDRRQLDVVTPDTLLAMLESREIGLRRRFQQIIDEMTQARDFLNRVKSPAASRGAEPGDSAAGAGRAGDEAEDERKSAERTQSLRLLRVQQALQQTRKSGQELLGVAVSFRDIRQELINNRVDTEDRKKRLKEMIADPIDLIAQTMFPELERRLDRLEKVLLEDLNAKRYDVDSGIDEAAAAVQQANDILAEMEEILQRMIDLETFSELLDIVRQLIKDEQRLIEETQKERKRSLLRDLQ